MFVQGCSKDIGDDRWLKRWKALCSKYEVSFYLITANSHCRYDYIQNLCQVSFKTKTYWYNNLAGCSNSLYIISSISNVTHKWFLNSFKTKVPII